MDILAPCYLWYVANAMGLVVAMAVAAVRITLCNILMMSLVKKLYFLWDTYILEFSWIKFCVFMSDLMARLRWRHWQPAAEEHAVFACFEIYSRNLEKQG